MSSFDCTHLLISWNSSCHHWEIPHQPSLSLLRVFAGETNSRAFELGGTFAQTQKLRIMVQNKDEVPDCILSCRILDLGYCSYLLSRRLSLAICSPAWAMVPWRITCALCFLKGSSGRDFKRHSFTVSTVDQYRNAYSTSWQWVLRQRCCCLCSDSDWGMRL